jgi:hypothetical protein
MSFIKLDEGRWLNVAAIRICNVSLANPVHVGPVRREITIETTDVRLVRVNPLFSEQALETLRKEGLTL